MYLTDMERPWADISKIFRGEKMERTGLGVRDVELEIKHRRIHIKEEEINEDKKEGQLSPRT